METKKPKTGSWFPQTQENEWKSNKKENMLAHTCVLCLLLSRVHYKVLCGNKQRPSEQEKGTARTLRQPPLALLFGEETQKQAGEWRKENLHSGAEEVPVQGTQLEVANMKTLEADGKRLACLWNRVTLLQLILNCGVNSKNQISWQSMTRSRLILADCCSCWGLSFYRSSRILSSNMIWHCMLVCCFSSKWPYYR